MFVFAFFDLIFGFQYRIYLKLTKTRKKGNILNIAVDSGVLSGYFKRHVTALVDFGPSSLFCITSFDIDDIIRAQIRFDFEMR